MYSALCGWEARSFYKENSDEVSRLLREEFFVAKFHLSGIWANWITANVSRNDLTYWYVDGKYDGVNCYSAGAANGRP